MEEFLKIEDALGLVVRWFAFVAEQATYGDLSDVSLREIARSVNWNKDPLFLWQGLLWAGWIDPPESDAQPYKESFMAHDWAQEHERFIKENEHRKEPRATQGKDTQNPRVSQGVSQGLPVQKEVQEVPERKNRERVQDLPASTLQIFSIWKDLYKRIKAGVDYFDEAECSRLWGDLAVRGVTLQEFNQRANHYLTDPFKQGFTLADLLKNFSLFKELRKKNLGGSGEHDKAGNKQGKFGSPAAKSGRSGQPNLGAL